MTAVKIGPNGRVTCKTSPFLLDKCYCIQYHGSEVKGMSRHVRIRCPICGMLSWQSRLDKEWEFEVIIQHTTSRGRGRITHQYYPPETEEGTWLLKLALIDKLRAVADQLSDEVGQDKDLVREELHAEGQWVEALAVATTYHADFADIGTAIEGLLGDVVVGLRGDEARTGIPVHTGVGLTQPAIISGFQNQLHLPSQVDEGVVGEVAPGVLVQEVQEPGLLFRKPQVLKAFSGGVAITKAEQKGKGEADVIRAKSRVSEEVGELASETRRY